MWLPEQCRCSLPNLNARGCSYQSVSRLETHHSERTHFAESDLAGYKVYIKDTASGAYGSPVTELQGNVTTFIATGLKIGTTYYFAITAYDSDGTESEPSAVVTYIPQ